MRREERLGMQWDEDSLLCLSVDKKTFGDGSCSRGESLDKIDAVCQSDCTCKCGL